ncbi:MAG: 50S ribosomal protein L9 [Pelagibacterales bacterium MED-G43]|nr:MAG: 50S ribosomal protein L9 [Pelagibacterales bacterium MED-G43]|tara:strand:- start:572 stop:1027 length:456 start_codon:yes stop_codon:yes gene_type:complete
MEIILLENILNLGNIGDKVKVKDGYGRNFLLKQGKALRFNKENQELVDKQKDKLNKKNNEIKNKFKETADIINNKTFTFFKECKDNGDLYGTVKPKEITNLIKESSKAEINPSQIILKEEINKIGIFKAEINFHSEVKANISLKIDKIQSR